MSDTVTAAASPPSTQATAPPTKGDVLLIPLYNPKLDDQAIIIKWTESFVSKSAVYYALVVTNTTRGNAEVPFFIQAEYYDEQHGLAPHIKNVGKETKGGYELTLNNAVQFGQKNKVGDSRFVVFHDTNRKIYQHRFLSTTLASGLLNSVHKLANLLVPNYTGWGCSRCIPFMGRRLPSHFPVNWCAAITSKPNCFDVQRLYCVWNTTLLSTGKESRLRFERN